ncbi:ABC transporter permease [Allosediminivita pacifica]|uniref:Peptide/nickel transport system permease protein n=1 Tax=Allosediminivita pacifica TaxID=1267769 RepID=A0A2T6ANH2_9RHOB|nr:ABC transporter permease [Allosediminivita pacifica]PTX45363.1 peptide/nickel transport system permease protein [Allosediminivita pacifica]GGB20665.1 ABC transporter [Allosediminivita pacifica]
MSLAYFLRRFGAVLVVLCIVSVAVFSITTVLPGNAALMILGENASAENLAALERQLGLDQPLIAQYFQWVGGVLQGDFGTSLRLQLPVAQVVGDAFWNSMALAAIALVSVTIIAIPLGTLAALRRGSVWDLLIGLLSYVGTALPEFVTATLLLVFFADPARQLLPAGGFVSPTEDFGGFLEHAILPSATLGLILMAHISRQVRSELSEVLSSDYVRAARLKGLREKRVIRRHALPNSLAPAVAVISLDIGYLLGGIIVVEEIFAWPGLGRLLIYALQNRDLPVIQAVTLLLAVVYALSNLLADVVIAKLDPRVRYA